MSDFHQEGPELRNQFEDDVTLRSLLRRKLTPVVFDDVAPGLPVLLRDAQVLSIWEGTTNVLALDALRAMRREGVLVAFLADVRRHAASVVDDDDGPPNHSALEPLADAVRGVLRDVDRQQAELPRMLETAGAEARARQTAYALSRACARALMLEQAAWQLREDPSAAATGAAVTAARMGVSLI